MKRSAESAFVVEQLPGSPGPSSYSPSEASTPLPSSECPPRKRSRSEVTPEERKEARAHRNRIAAQNSRDRRKAQFSHLERRVAELEEENRHLRAGMGLAPQSPSAEQLSQERQKELAREKENQELRERIKTLENGWDAVIKALAASGLPLAVPAPPPHPSDSTTAPSRPVFAQPTHSYPSPAPSSPSSSSGFEFDEYEPTRHLARVATTDAPLLSSVPQQRVDSQRINLSSSSPLPPRHRPPPRRCPSTKAPWRISSVRSSHRRLYSRRRLCPSASPSRRPPSLRPPGRPL
ncbi:bZIP domain-containing protein [Phanerochaete sordida]|uniref:X-box-binding protein 1 n=1 Tax=Phanerochaete sordida TaxID=48140 RepID=A0A9P3GEU3_9APHY|nr:bZIP domain-containing protein [Phanerochaete sordida]